MKKPFTDAYNVLKVMGVPVFANEDHEELGNFGISAEDTKSSDWCDYYSQRKDWDFGVNPAIEDVLNQFGLFAEWQNPGCLHVFEV